MQFQRLTALLCICLIVLSGCTHRQASVEMKTETPDPVVTTPVPDWVAYANKLDGYQIEYPGAWTLDSSRQSSVTRLVAGDHMGIIDIFVQPLINRVTTADYLGYSNQHIIKQEQGVALLAQSNLKINNTPAYLLMWKRPPIVNRAGDLYLYREISLQFPGKIYTFSLKTDPAHLSQYSPVLDHVVASCALKTPENIAPPAAPSAAVPDIDLQGKTMQLHIPGNQMLFGIFNPVYHPFKYKPQDLAAFSKHEQNLGYRFDFIMTYILFWQSFPERLVADTYSSGRIMMLTWHPIMNMPPRTDSIIIPAIINGEYDPYIKDWAQHVKALGEPVFIRFANEMNGDWDPWCAWFFSKDTDLYIDAWRHVYQIFKQEGADNALFVWNPHDRTFPNFKWNSPEMYYPGADYVDWVGLTCYNNGTSHPADKWRDFNSMYQPIYKDYLSKYPGKPFMITEFSSNEVGGNKSAWIKDCLTSLKNYPNIRIAVWYDQDDGKWLYRLDSTPAAQAAFKKGISNSYFVKNGVTRMQEKSASPTPASGPPALWPGGNGYNSKYNFFSTFSTPAASDQ